MSTRIRPWITRLVGLQGRISQPFSAVGSDIPVSDRTVCMLCPGGFEHAGGIGRWAGYLFAAWPDIPHAPRLRLIDTRGHGNVAVGGAAFATALLRVLAAWARGQVGLIHINLSVRGSTVRKCGFSVLAHLCRIPVVVHLHSGRFDTFYRDLPRWAKIQVDRMFQRAACIIVPGKIWETMLVTEIGVKGTPIFVMPNAVAGPGPRPQGTPGSDCHIVMLGRMGPPKGLPELMEALGSPTLRDLPWRITMAGDGDGDTYRKEAEARGIAKKVSILGWQTSDGVAALLASADVLVLPSRSENLPISVIEALSYGVAVVTTPVGAIPEIVENEVSALLVPVQNPEALALALRRVVTDPVFRQTLAQEGYKAFQRRLDIRGYAKSLTSIYNDVLRGETVVSGSHRFQ